MPSGEIKINDVERHLWLAERERGAVGTLAESGCGQALFDHFCLHGNSPRRPEKAEISELHFSQSGIFPAFRLSVRLPRPNCKGQPWEKVGQDCPVFLAAGRMYRKTPFQRAQDTSYVQENYFAWRAAWRLATVSAFPPVSLVPTTKGSRGKDREEIRHLFLKPRRKLPLYRKTILRRRRLSVSPKFLPRPPSLLKPYRQRTGRQFWQRTCPLIP